MGKAGEGGVGAGDVVDAEDVHASLSHGETKADRARVAECCRIAD